jgi:hypothetical protein
MKLTEIHIPRMHFDARYRFGNVISYRLYDKNFTTKLLEFYCQIWLLGKLKLAENWKNKNGFS